MPVSDRQQPEIIRTQIIIIKEKTTDSYGNILLRDLEGNEYKISAKRAVIAEHADINTQVELQWTHWKDVDYIYRIKTLSGPSLGPAPTTKPAITPKPVLSTHQKESIPSKNASFALSYIKDLVVAHIIPLNEMFQKADECKRWLDENS